MQNVIDPERKSTLSEILKTSVPAVIDLAALPLIWAYETGLIGRISAEALAGIGVARQLIIVTFTLLLTFVMGSSLIINKHLGKKDVWEANHIFGQAMFLGVVSSFLIGGLWYAGSPLFFKVIKEGGDFASRAYGVSYMQTLAWYTPILVTYFLALGILRSTGDSKFSMVISLISNGLNLILAPIFIFGRFGLPRMEVLGAAYASVICAALGLIIAIFVLRSRKTKLYFSFHEFRQPKWKSVKLLFSKGLPTTVEQLTWSAGQLVVMGFVARFGVIVLAAHNILQIIQALLSMLYTGFALSTMAIVGQNVGSKDYDKVEKTGYMSSVTIAAVMLGLGSIMYVFTPQIWSVFTNNQEIKDFGMSVMWIYILVQIPKSISSVMTGALRGAGDIKWTMVVMMIGVLLSEIGLNWHLLFLFHFGYTAVWMVHGFDEITRLTTYLIRFNSRKWVLNEEKSTI